MLKITHKEVYKNTLHIIALNKDRANLIEKAARAYILDANWNKHTLNPNCFTYSKAVYTIPYSPLNKFVLDGSIPRLDAHLSTSLDHYGRYTGHIMKVADPANIYIQDLSPIIKKYSDPEPITERENPNPKETEFYLPLPSPFLRTELSHG